MKSTKIMLAVIAMLFSTWTSLSLLGYLLSDLSFRDCYTNSATLFAMVIFGWIPALIVGIDLDKQLED